MNRSSISPILSILIGVVPLVWALGCQDDESGFRPPGPREYRLASFPQTPGSQWIYQYGDTSFGGGADTTTCTLRITIARVDTIDGFGPMSVWILDCGGELDTLYLSGAGEVAAFYPSPESLGPTDELTFPLEFPLYVGKSWPALRASSTSVDTERVVSTPAGDFTSLLVVQDRSQPNEGHVQWVDFVPGVGIVRMREGYFFSLHREGFRRGLILVDYHIGTTIR